MKIVEHFNVPAKDLDSFLKELNTDNFNVDYNLKKNEFHFTVQEDYTEPQFHMLVLRTTLNNVDNLTDEERSAIEYSISCIKTLEDMGVIK